MNESRRRQLLQRMAAYGDRNFDPAAGLLRLPMDGYRNVHAEHLDDTPRHPLRESLCYALVLLELADRPLQGRAEAIMERVIALQEAASADPALRGLWPYFLEEPVAAWPWPDLNWADFIGMALLVIWHRHRRRLPARLRARIVESVHRAAGCIRLRNVDLNYTNIAIKGSFVTLSAAELTDDRALLDYALDRLARLRDTVAEAGAFAEYNSPTYAAVSLAGLHAIAAYAAHPEARELVEPLLARFWDDVARHFHPGTGELAGPHARAYAPSLHASPGLLGALIEKASRGVVSYPEPEEGRGFGGLYACVMNVDAPAGATALLGAVIREPRQVVTRSRCGAAEAPRVRTTWLEPAFCLGSVSFQDGWEQRNNLIAYWKSNDGGVGVLRHRYLRDDRPCCSGYFVSEQREGAVAAGAFLAAYADHHVSVTTDGTTCSFLGPVLELDTDGEEADVRVDGRRVPLNATVEISVGDVVRIALAGVTLEIVLTRHDVVPAPKTGPRLERPAAGALRIVLPHHEGRRRALKWGDFERAVSAYTLRMAATGAPPPSADGLRATLPEAPPVSQAAAEAWGLEQASVAT